MNFLFGKKKEEGPKAAPTDALTTMREHTSTMEKRIQFLQKKIDAEVVTAKAKAKAGDKRSALMAIKRKNQWIAQQTQLQNQQFTMESQLQMLEGTQMTKSHLEAMKEGNKMMKGAQKDMNVDDVADLMDEMQDAQDDMAEINDALSQPMGFGADMDDADLEAELEGMEAEMLDEQLAAMDSPQAQPDTGLPAVPVQAAATAVGGGDPPSRGGGGGSGDEEAELAALEAEMAM